MRKSLILLLLSVVILSQTVTADTIHLKNGSVLKGKVSSFADDQFVIVLDTGSGRYMSKATVFMGDVSRIDFDSAPAVANDGPNTALQPSDTPPRVIAKDSVPPETKTHNNETVIDSPARQPQRTETPSRDMGPPEVPTTASRSSEAPQDRPERDVSTTAKISDNERPFSNPRGKLKSTTLELPGKRDSGRDWMSSQILVEVGDRVRVTATGTITLNREGTRMVSPEGMDLLDPEKLLQNQPTGGLIGVIGSDDDDYFFIGKSVEFRAIRKGLLFLAINEGNLTDNSGSFRVTIEVLPQQKAPK